MNVQIWQRKKDAKVDFGRIGKKEKMQREKKITGRESVSQLIMEDSLKCTPQETTRDIDIVWIVRLANNVPSSLLYN